MVDSIYKIVIFSDNTVFMTLQQCKLVYQVRDLKVIIGLKSTLPADNTATFRGTHIQHLVYTGFPDSYITYMPLQTFPSM